MLTKRHVVGAGYDPQCPSLLLQRLEVYHDLDAGVVYPLWYRAGRSATGGGSSQ